MKLKAKFDGAPEDIQRQLEELAAKLRAGEVPVGNHMKDVVPGVIVTFGGDGGGPG